MYLYMDDRFAWFDVLEHWIRSKYKYIHIFFLKILCSYHFCVCVIELKLHPKHIHLLLPFYSQGKLNIITQTRSPPVCRTHIYMFVMLSACFKNPRLLLGHPSSLMSVHVLKSMHTQTAPLINIPCKRCGTTTRAVTSTPLPLPLHTQAGNRTWESNR